MKTATLGKYVELAGAGPFQFPLTGFVGIDPGHKGGWFVLRFRTETGTILHLPVQSGDAGKLGLALLEIDKLREHKKSHSEGH